MNKPEIIYRPEDFEKSRESPDSIDRIDLPEGVSAEEAYKALMQKFAGLKGERANAIRDQILDSYNLTKRPKPEKDFTGQIREFEYPASDLARLYHDYIINQKSIDEKSGAEKYDNPEKQSKKEEILQKLEEIADKPEDWDREIFNHSNNYFSRDEILAWSELKQIATKSIIKRFKESFGNLREYIRQRDGYARLGFISSDIINNLPEIKKIACETLLGMKNFYKLWDEKLKYEEELNNFIEAGIFTSDEINSYPELSWDFVN